MHSEKEKKFNAMKILPYQLYNSKPKSLSSLYKWEMYVQSDLYKSYSVGVWFITYW